MSRLSDVIYRVIDEYAVGGSLNVAEATRAALGMLGEDETSKLAEGELARRIKNAFQTMKRELVEALPEQPSLFPSLKAAHQLDEEARTMKLTTELTQMEFARVIGLREKQVAADTAYLKELKGAYSTVQPIWTRNPDLTFGEVCGLYVAGKVAA